MIEPIKSYVEKVDGMSLRQRVLVFVALALALVFIVNALFIGPLRIKQRRLAGEITAQQKEMTTLQAEAQRLAQGTVDPDAANRSRLSALGDELRKLNANILDEQRRVTPPERMQRVLEEMLEKNRGLTLVDLKTLPAIAVTVQRQGGVRAGMYRHGIELTVQGTYGDLYEYLTALEKMPSQLYWGRAELAVVDHPVLSLKLTVHTLSFERAWLVV
jgi:MSHA biogenesis protein MshJ